MDDASQATAIAIVALVLILMEAKRITRLERELSAVIDGDEEMLKMLRMKRKLEADG